MVHQWSLVCAILFVFSVSAYAKEVYYSQYLRKLAKEINSDPDVLWTAYDPDMTEEEHKAREMVVQARIEKAMQTSSKNRWFDIMEQEQPLELQQIQPLASIDWRTSGLLRGVEDQGQCGSCWVFSTTHCMNDVINIQRGDKNSLLSIQDTLECCHGEGCGGCNGGYLQSSYDFMSLHGTVDGVCKPYSPYPSRCSTQCIDGSSAINKQHWLPTGYKPIFTPGANGRSAVMTGLQNGPVSGSMMVYEDFMSYRSGIYHHRSGANQGGHAIEIVGYGGTGSGSYWIVKNSWGTRWGNNGFFQIVMGTDECQFESMERGYASGYRTSPRGLGARVPVHVEQLPTPDMFVSLDTTDDDTPPPPITQRPGTDEVINANTTNGADQLIMDAVAFILPEINPIYCSGNVSLYQVMQAEKQLVSGTVIYLKIAVNGTSCDRGVEVFFAQVYCDFDGTFSLQTLYALGTLAENLPCDQEQLAQLQNQANAASANMSTANTWKAVGAAFIVLSVVLFLLTLYLCTRLQHASRAGPNTGETAGAYHNMNEL